MKRRLVLLGLTAAVAAVATLPLALVARSLATAGLAADEASGSVWNGTLRAARLGGHPLGDLDVALPALPLLLGQQQLDVSGANWSARLSRGSRKGVLSSGGLLPSITIAPLHGATIEVSLRQARLVFEDGRCIEGAGSVGAVLQWPDARLPELELEGPVECARGLGQVTLTNGDRGAFPVQLLATVMADGSYRLQATAQPADPATRAALVAGGFHETPSGLGRIVEGSLFE
jgi:hypothetical protein